MSGNLHRGDDEVVKKENSREKSVNKQRMGEKRMAEKKWRKSCQCDISTSKFNLHNPSPVNEGIYGLSDFYSNNIMTSTKCWCSSCDCPSPFYILFFYLLME